MVNGEKIKGVVRLSDVILSWWDCCLQVSVFAHETDVALWFETTSVDPKEIHRTWYGTVRNHTFHNWDSFAGPYRLTDILIWIFSQQQWTSRKMFLFSGNLSKLFRWFRYYTHLLFTSSYYVWHVLRCVSQVHCNSQFQERSFGLLNLCDIWKISFNPFWIFLLRLNVRF